jgi:hypothetical protein
MPTDPELLKRAREMVACGCTRCEIAALILLRDAGLYAEIDAVFGWGPHLLEHFDRIMSKLGEAESKEE